MVVKKKIYYKVVTQDLKSALSEFTNNKKTKELSLQYREQCWVGVQIPFTNMMVFNTLNDARNFISQIDGSYKIYECEVINPKKVGVFISLLWAGDMKSRIERLATLRRSKKKYLQGKGICKFLGTIFVDAVKLTKLVS